MADGQTLILHQYPSSPFSEKIRLALKLKNLACATVEAPVIMPKPLLLPLTGGYRRIPVLQIGADVYCDTAIILREIEKRHPRRPLQNPGHEGLHAMVGAFCDRQWFQASVALIFGAIGDHVPDDFKKDREALSGRPFDTNAMKAAAPLMRDQWRSMLMWIEERLEASRGAGAGAWLMGSNPGLCDVHAHMNPWFVQQTVPDFLEDCLTHAPRTRDWFNRLNESQGQTPEEITGEDALKIAKQAAPRLVAASVSDEPQGLRPGDQIAVSADDYGRDPVVGELVYASPQRITLQRVDEQAETIHVHFPRAGFVVSKLGA